MCKSGRKTFLVFPIIYRQIDLLEGALIIGLYTSSRSSAIISNQMIKSRNRFFFNSIKFYENFASLSSLIFTKVLVFLKR